ncbi:MAG: hypothetical protein ISP01_07055 [Methanobrevibacter arboriphilus]|uniref:Uncharacterized protein n=1 Tax=Methanobrevibacter arboriphilus TaxID=39441 RepID=A0A843ANR7_METAZ|nr:hypothetical protein [Methanobrevibacter arboriphilus]MBF4469148.1 hypothetical protein [Methanobrevibacter arboriphilus]
MAYNMLTGTNNINPASIGKTQIVVDSDTKFNGSIKIYKYSNLESNENGSYNMTQFFKPGFIFRDYTGIPIEIPIVDGKASYDIPNDVQFFIVYSYGSTNKDFGYTSDSNDAVTVSFYSNGVLVAQSISELYADQFDIDFGGTIYDLKGGTMEDIDLVNDTSKYGI